MRTGPKQFKVGQKVTVLTWVYKQTRVDVGHRRAQEYTERRLKGTITRVGIKYVDITVHDKGREYKREFIVNSGRERNSFGKAQSFNTLDGSADFERVARARLALILRGIRLRAVNDLHRETDLEVDQWEALAAVVEQWPIKTK